MCPAGFLHGGVGIFAKCHAQLERYRSIFGVLQRRMECLLWPYTIKNNWLIEQIAVDSWVQKSWSEGNLQVRFHFMNCMWNYFQLFQFYEKLKLLPRLLQKMDQTGYFWRKFRYLWNLYLVIVLLLFSKRKYNYLHMSLSQTISGLFNGCVRICHWYMYVCNVSSSQMVSFPFASAK